MKPIILPANTVTFPAAGTNGIGRLSDCFKCLVTEEINSTYTLTAECMADSLHADLCTEGNYLYVPHDSTGDLQPFEIRKVEKKSDGRMKIYAEHISYKLTRATVEPFTAGYLDLVMYRISQNMVPQNNFSFGNEFSSSVNFEMKRPMTARSVLNGEEGSILDVYGQGEWEFDKWVCTLKTRRGADNGARIRNKHNLTELIISSEAQNGYNAVYPYYYDSITGTLVRASQDGTTGYVVLQNGATTYDKVIPLDLTDRFTAVPQDTDVRSAAETWLANNKPWEVDPVISVKYSALIDDSASSVVLGDTVLVQDTKLNYSASHRIVKTVWDVLNERYDSVGVGKLPPTLYDLIKKVK